MAGFQYGPGGEGAGLHIQAVPGGLPFAIHLPGTPGVGTTSMASWDPLTDFVRDDTIPIFLGRTPSISFGTQPAVALNHYTSLDGLIQIDSITLPAYREFLDRGRVRGRLEARAAADSRLLAPGTPVEPDTVDIAAEFLVEVEGWHDGRASVEFAGGSLDGRSVPDLHGSGNDYYIDGPVGEADPQLVVLLIGTFPETAERLYMWFGTKLRLSGEVEVEGMNVDSIFFARHWPDHFAAGLIVPAGSPSEELWENGRPFVAVSGTLALEENEEHIYPRWGESRGRFTAELEIGIDAEGVERSSAEIAFHVPSFWFVEVQEGPPPQQAAPFWGERR